MLGWRTVNRLMDETQPSTWLCQMSSASQTLLPTLSSYKDMGSKRIKMIVDAFKAGICITCFNEPTEDWCFTCVKKRGVKRIDLVNGKITIEQINALPYKSPN